MTAAQKLRESAAMLRDMARRGIPLTADQINAIADLIESEATLQESLAGLRDMTTAVPEAAE